MIKADYGIDAPPVIRNLFLAGLACLALRFFYASSWFSWSAGIFIAQACAMILYAKVGKFRHRERMLGIIAWKGDESVLDVGTGRGLLMIGAAKRLKTGRAVGIDIWNSADLSGNGAQATERNIEAEGVRDRTELKTEDARRMSFADATFDVVLSNLALHNIPDAAGRAAACQEIARVLKRGGTALVSDFQKTGEYQAAFAAAGLNARRTAPYLTDTFPPLRIVVARKD